MKSEDSKGVSHLSITLYPTPIPKNIYNKIVFYEVAFNKIFLRLSQDQEFLLKILEPVGESDPFINKNFTFSK